MPPEGQLAPFDPNVTGMSTNLLSQAQAPTTEQEPMIFAGYTKQSTGQRYQIGGGDQVRDLGKTKVPTFLTISQFMSRFDDQSRDDFLHLRNLMIAAGIVSPEADPYTVRSAFASILGQVGDMTAQGMNVSPMGYVKNLIRMNGKDPSEVGSGANYGVNGVGAGGAEEPFTGTKTMVNRSVTEISEGEAWANLRSTVSQMIGRDPTDDELRKFTYRMNSLAAANPAISKTITRYKDGEMVGSRTHTDPGFTSADMAESAYNRAQNDPEYGEYQAATTYFNALQSALGPIGNTAGGIA